MIITYGLKPEYKPSERQIWLMSKRAEDEGIVLTQAIMRGFADGMIKYHEGELYKFCPSCCDWFPFSNYYSSPRNTYGVQTLCPSCIAMKKRIAHHCTPIYVTDKGMGDMKLGIEFNLSPHNRQHVLNNLGGKDEFIQEE